MVPPTSCMAEGKLLCLSEFSFSISDTYLYLTEARGHWGVCHRSQQTPIDLQELLVGSLLFQPLSADSAAHLDFIAITALPSCHRQSL